MIQMHHISDDLLVSYAAGSLAEGWSLAVATHLAHCPQCRARVEQASAVGGVLLSGIDSVAMEAGALDKVMSRLTDAPRTKPAPAARQPGADMPSPLVPYLGAKLDDVSWKRLGTAAHQVLIPTGDRSTSVRLLRIPAGAPVPEHGHRGLELTVVLRGTLVDGAQRFGVGEVEEADSEVEHQPVAGDEGECICLAVTDAPLRFRSMLLRLVQPVLGI